MARQSMKQKISAAVSSATASARKRASAARKALSEIEDRKPIRIVETLGGGAVAGGLHGAGISIEWGETDIPVGLVAGGVAIAAGESMGSEDLTDIGLGMAAYGAGRLLEDLVDDWLFADEAA